MNIITSWKKSISIFMPKNIKIFTLVVLRSIRDTYRLLWQNAPWMVCIYIFATSIALLSGLIMVQENDLALRIKGISYKVFMASGFLMFLSGICLFFYVVLFARNSLHKKDGTYLCEWRRKYMVPLYLGLIFGAIIFMPINGILFYLMGSEKIFWLQEVTNFIFNTAYFLFIFFFLDMIGKAHKTGWQKVKEWLLIVICSLKNSLKMLVYNFPAFFLVQLIFTAVMYLLFCMNLSVQFWSVLRTFFALLSPMRICLYGALYTKYSYEQVALYIEGPKR